MYLKKIPLVLVLAFCLCLLIGCEALDVLHDVAEQLGSAVTDTTDSSPAEDESAAEAEPAVEDEPTLDSYAEPASASDITGGDEPEPQEAHEAQDTDFTALSLEECVTDADGAAGQLPRIVLACPGADSINEDIEGTFRYLVDADYCTLYYTASKNGRVLSVMIAQLFDGDSSYYTPYLLDLSTGERMSGRDLLDRMGLSAEDVSAAELAIMGQEFEYQYGAESLGENADFYEEQYERTVSEDNAELSRLWLGDGGELNFVARIFSMAGAEFYEYPMGTGYAWR